jgi:hypothetical protein
MTLPAKSLSSRIVVRLGGSPILGVATIPGGTTIIASKIPSIFLLDFGTTPKLFAFHFCLQILIRAVICKSIFLARISVNMLMYTLS